MVKKLISLHPSPETHCVGNGFHVQAVFDYKSGRMGEISS